MKYIKYYVSSKEGKSNCVIRSFCKLYKEEYEKVYNDLLEIMKEYKDYLFHLKGALIGCLYEIPACALIGLLVIIL